MNHLIGNQHAKGNPPNSTSFSAGHIPWNKGKKGLHLSPSTEFKKGRKPEKTLSVLSITQRIDKNGTIRAWIKTAEPNYWIEYAKYIWKQKYGNIPNGYIIHHKDKNSLNDDINNLELLTRSEHIKVHGINRWMNLQK